MVPDYSRDMRIFSIFQPWKIISLISYLFNIIIIKYLYFIYLSLITLVLQAGGGAGHFSEPEGNSGEGRRPEVCVMKGTRAFPS